MRKYGICFYMQLSIIFNCPQDHSHKLLEAIFGILSRIKRVFTAHNQIYSYLNLNSQMSNIESNSSKNGGLEDSTFYCPLYK